MPDREKVIKAVDICIGHGHCEDCSYCLIGAGYTTMDCRKRMLTDALALLKEQEDLGTELTNAVELIHKKNDRIKILEEQIETLTRWRLNAGAFD